jgi:hypothetical protein
VLRNNSQPQFTEPQRKDDLPRQEDVAVCPSCGQKWLEQVIVQQFDKIVPVVPGQGVPTVHGQRFIILRCIQCGELLEPNVMLTSFDTTRKAYDAFLDALEGKPSGTKPLAR